MNVMAGGGGGPYLGRRTFTADDHGLFFGRDLESLDIQRRWRENRLVVLYGPAGCGKTSILQAGVLPGLSKDTDGLPLGRALGGSSFPEPLLPGHNPYSLSVLSSWFPGEARTSLAQFSLTDVLRRRSQARDLSRTPVPLLVAIDQIEELFADGRNEQHRDEFFQDLAVAAREIPRLRVLFSTRTDALRDLAPYEQQVSGGSAVRIPLSPLTVEAAIEAARRPMEKAGGYFAPGAAEYLVGELATTGSPGHAREGTAPAPAAVEPVLLQVVCSSLWRAVPPGTPAITTAFIRRRLDVDQVLADFCADVLAAAAARHQVPLPKLLSWMEQDFINGHGHRDDVATTGRSAGATPAAVARTLENEHLLKAAEAARPKQYQLSSDRLAEALRYLIGASASRNFSSLAQLAGGSFPDAAARIRIAESALAEGDLTLAESHAEGALETADSADLRLRAEAQSLLGNITYQLRQPKQAEDHYRLAAQLREQMGDHPAVARLLGAIGRMHARQGLHVAALEELQAAVTRLPSDLSLQTELATVLWEAGESQAAAAVFGSVLTVEPLSADALAGRGQISAERGSASAALDDLEALQKLQPRAGLRPEVRAAYALALARTGRPESAMAEADAALASAQDSGIILLRAAQVARAGGALDRAMELLRRAEQASHPALSSDQLSHARRLRRQVTIEPDPAVGRSR